MTPEETFIALIPPALTLMSWSMLYKPNAFFRFAENIIVGGMAGYGTVLALKAVWSRGVIPGVGGNMVAGLATIFGLLIFFRFGTRETRWLSRIPVAVLIGVGFGASLRSMIQAQITAQIIDTMRPLVLANLQQTSDNIIIFVGTVTTLFYFFYSVEHKGAFAMPSKIGRLIMMSAFGATFGFAFQGRIAMLAGIMGSLVKAPGMYLVPVAAVLIVYEIWRDTQRARRSH